MMARTTNSSSPTVVSQGSRHQPPLADLPCAPTFSVLALIYLIPTADCNHHPFVLPSVLPAQNLTQLRCNRRPSVARSMFDRSCHSKLDGMLKLA